MVKRIVDTKFWTTMQVIDQYSVEDKYFALYLMTNDKSSQLGIYSLPKKVMSFETGFTIDVIQVLLDRFSKDYGQIIYSEKTQEVTLLKSLSYSILRGGKPVSDLLERELRVIQDGSLILETYQEMKEFWITSKRPFDQTIRFLFEEELTIRNLMVIEKEDEKIKSYQIEKEKEFFENADQSHGLLINTDQSSEEELIALERYTEFLNFKKPNFTQKIKTDEILSVFYQELLGEVTLAIQETLKAWEEILPKSLILEALVRSIDKFRPISYARTVIENWEEKGVKDLRDVSRLDREYNRKEEELSK